MNQITDGGQRENTVGVEITLTEEETDQLASSAEDSKMDQMINVPNKKKIDQMEEETDEKQNSPSRLCHVYMHLYV